ncbi:NAD(P)-dependent oxidoreductase [Acuticoccus sediminis]|uniref:NAD(P)-dependent oxidoreductase n=1 Tax=Acuticoccus sediminis TaxID=2184697 RepID=A0A8B2NVP0_9HYPH|nr:NAD(P)-dependent oxidoreductase [Acuticoccus sediminis]RAI02388.1 NAD(P)-dependent oxidoreductase [Acuticoccus sediminis]
MATPGATVGFIGLGLMGRGFAERLIANGHTVVGTDVRAEALAAAGALGVRTVGSAAEVAAASDHVLACVTTPKDLDKVVRGDAGVLSASGLAGKVFVDHSTTDIPLTRSLAAALAEAGMGFLDAPVSGGPGAAQTGTLAIMAGGAAMDFGKVEPILAGLGRTTLMGDVGAGQATKLVNQTLVLTNYCVIAEAYRLAEAFGVDAAKIPHALAPGHAGSNLLEALMPRLAAEDFAPRGYARQILKDLEMLHTATRDMPLALPMAGQALTLYRLLVASGKAELDGSSVVTLYPKATPAETAR